jgi:cold-inducible RNA-binding protein
MNIYVGNLSFDVTDDELRQEFAAFGDVSSVNIIKDKLSGRSKGFAFVEMPVLSQGQAAMNALNDKKIKDRAISVSGAKARTDTRGPDRRGGGGGGGGYNRGGGSSRGGGRGGGGGGRRY